VKVGGLIIDVCTHKDFDNRMILLLDSQKKFLLNILIYVKFRRLQVMIPTKVAHNNKECKIKNHLDNYWEFFV